MNWSKLIKPTLIGPEDERGRRSFVRGAGVCAAAAIGLVASVFPSGIRRSDSKNTHTDDPTRPIEKSKINYKKSRSGNKSTDEWSHASFTENGSVRFSKSTQKSAS